MLYIPKNLGHLTLSFFHKQAIFYHYLSQPNIKRPILAPLVKSSSPNTPQHQPLIPHVLFLAKNSLMPLLLLHLIDTYKR